MKTDLDWKLGHAKEKTLCPTEWIPATVPGAVQTDYAAAHGLPDRNRGENIKEYLWMQDEYWVYKTEADLTGNTGKHAFLIFKGIDYKYEIYVEGEQVARHEGLYREQRIDLEKWLGKKAEIKVLIYPCPKSDLDYVIPGTRDEANQSTKPAVSYGWDFHPRAIPLGIWNDAYLLFTENENLPAPDHKYRLSEDRKTADLRLFGGLDGSVWRLYDPDGKLILEEKGAAVDATVSDVKLWWCAGYGEPNLYKWELTTGDLKDGGYIGFKTVALVKGEGTWRELKRYPMTRNTPPITVMLNGTAIFAKGINWVAPEIYYGAASEESFDRLLKLAKAANFNYLRCWGGAIVNKEYFFDLCDKLGLLVWQEFPLACNMYRSTEKYLDILRNEATDIIRRVSRHACLMLWCGGNELFNNWSKMTDQSLALRTLNALTLENTPEIPFLPTAPVAGMAHGPYSFLVKPDDTEVIKVIAESRCTAYTEVGVPSFSNADTLKLITDDISVFTDKNASLSALHNMEHLDLNILKRYFGEELTIEEMIEKSQYLQAIGLQFIYEEARRQKPYCSMVGAWCLNEPWPCVENNSIVSYPASVKPAYHTVAAACRPVVASARFEKLGWQAGELLELQLYLLNDLPEKLPDGSVKVRVKIGGREEELLTWEYKDVPVNVNAVGPVARYPLPEVAGADSIKITLESGEYSSEYTLLYSVPKRRKTLAALNVLDV